MKIRLFLAMLFALSLGTSIYYTKKAPVSGLEKKCCDGDPNVIIIPLPTPTPTPTN